MLLFSYLQSQRKIGRPRKHFWCRLSCDRCQIEFDLCYDQIRKCEEVYGRHLCKSCKISAALSGKSKSLEHRKNLSLAVSGKKHPQYGKHEWRGKNQNYNVLQRSWKGKTIQEIHGIEKAREMSKKQSIAASGSNNAMYGKPAPIGSGNGWSGWYIGRYFRSLLELAFMVQHPNAINAEIVIRYLNHENIERTYHPDFILEDKIVEVKPKKLLNAVNNIRKFEAARKLFGDQFIVATENDIMVLDHAKVKALVDNGSVKFIKRYQDKYEVWLAKSTPN